VLTQAGIMALTAGAGGTSPTRRGKFIREQFMCQPPPPPPANVDQVLPKATPGQTARDIYKAHVANPACAACHSLMDPIGFGFENYDGIGKYRTMDGAAVIDASGEVTASRDLDGKFTGAVALAKKMAGSEQVRDCLVKQVFRFAYGRDDLDTDKASFAEAARGFSASGLDLRELQVATVKTEVFRSRLVEVAP